MTGVAVTPLPAGEAQPRGPARLSVPRPATPTPRLPQAGAARGGPWRGTYAPAAEGTESQTVLGDVGSYSASEPRGKADDRARRAPLKHL